MDQRLSPYGKLDRIQIGKGCFINSGLRIGANSNAAVMIGDYCAIGPYVSLETGTHPLYWRPEGGWNWKPEGGWDEQAKPIRIGDKCWIGTRAIILPGVTIGEGCVVAAGAVVTKDVEPYSLVAGVPAKTIRRINKA